MAFFSGDQFTAVFDGECGEIRIYHEGAADVHAQCREAIPMAPAGHDQDGTRPLDEPLTEFKRDVRGGGWIEDLRIGDGANDACKHPFR